MAQKGNVTFFVDTSLSQLIVIVTPNKVDKVGTKNQLLVQENETVCVMDNSDNFVVLVYSYSLDVFISNPFSVHVYIKV